MRKLRANDGSCLVVACIVVAVIVALVVAAGGFAVYQVNKVATRYTDTEGIELPLVDMSQEEVDALLARLDGFRAALEAGEANEPLELTQDDLNALIQNDDEFNFFRGKVYLTLTDDKVGGEVSWPLDEIPLMGGRYFNGTATFDVEFRDRRPVVYLESASIKGEAVPDVMMDEVRKENFAAEWSRSDEGSAFLKNIETLEVLEGRLIITPKQPSDEELSIEESSNEEAVAEPEL
jgi:hypothetical protein